MHEAEPVERRAEERAEVGDDAQERGVALVGGEAERVDRRRAVFVAVEGEEGVPPCFAGELEAWPGWERLRFVLLCVIWLRRCGETGREQEVVKVDGEWIVFRLVILVK